MLSKAIAKSDLRPKSEVLSPSFDSIYTVQKGDTLMKLGLLFNMSTKQIQKLNDLPASDCSLIAGMRLKVLDKADHTKHPDLAQHLEKYGGNESRHQNGALRQPELEKLQEAK